MCFCQPRQNTAKKQKIVAYQKEKERRKMKQNFIDEGLTKDQEIRSRRKNRT